ncbi:MAG: hypothetical protein ABIH23_27280, partial [bacterium]
RTKTMLIDFTVFGGNSGGPVCYYQGTMVAGGLEEGEDGLIAGVSMYQEMRQIMGLVSGEIRKDTEIEMYTKKETEKIHLSLAEIVHASLIRDTITIFYDKYKNK